MRRLNATVPIWEKELYMKKALRLNDIAKFIMMIDGDVNVDNIPEIKYPRYRSEQDWWYRILQHFFVWRMLQIKDIHVDWINIDMTICGDGVDFTAAMRLVGYYYVKACRNGMPVWNKRIKYTDVRKALVINDKSILASLDAYAWADDFPLTTDSHLLTGSHMTNFLTSLCKYTGKNLINPNGYIRYISYEDGWYNYVNCHMYNMDFAPLMGLLAASNDPAIDRIRKVVTKILKMIPGYPLKDIPFSVYKAILMPALSYVDCCDKRRRCRFGETFTTEIWMKWIQSNIDYIEEYVDNEIERVEEEGPATYVYGH